jgi:anti-sigma B factor antagonist
MTPESPAEKPRLDVSTTRTGDRTTVVCKGRVVGETAKELSREVRAAIPDSQVIVVDLSNVSYMDSSGLGALVSSYVSAKKAGKTIKLLKLSDRVAELLRISKLASVFEGYGEYL